MRTWVFLGFCLFVVNAYPTPSPDLYLWSKLEVGAQLCLDMVTELVNESNGQFFCIGVGGNASYLPPPTVWNPSQLDTDQWLEAAARFGAKYVVLVAQHCSGFSLWPSNIYDATGFNYTYTVAHSKWRGGKGDIVADFIKSCKKYNIKPGIYYSLNQNFYLNVAGGRVQTTPLVPGQHNVSQALYWKIARAQMKELWTNYGDLYEIWFDGGALTPGIRELALKLQPNAICFQGVAGLNTVRWVGTESGQAPDPCWSTNDPGNSWDKYGAGDPNGTIWEPAESDTYLFDYDLWFWKPNVNIRSFSEMKDVYRQSAGHNTNLLLAITPNSTGLVPDDHMERYQQLGEWVTECFTESISETSGKGYVHSIQFPHQPINHIITQEEQLYGQRIRGYTIYANVDGVSIPIVEGTAVGNKKIDAFAEPIITSEIILVISSAVDTPIVSKFAVYNCDY